MKTTVVQKWTRHGTKRCWGRAKSDEGGRETIIKVGKVVLVLKIFVMMVGIMNRNNMNKLQETDSENFVG